MSLLRPAPLRSLCAALIAMLCLAPQAQARCNGQNLLAEMDAADSAAVAAATAAQPFATGNLWQASKEGQHAITLLGTYHMADPRHDAVVARIAPLIAEASALLVEAGPEEERALKRDIAADPSLLFLTDGASLMEQMPPEEWAQISAAMAARNIPAFMGAKMRPWYLATMLAIAPCDMAEVAAGKGLDHRVMDLATDAGKPIRALEPHTTLFGIFETLTPDQQLDMLRSSMLMEDRIADYANTLAEGYFNEDSRRIWEYLRVMAQDFPGYTPERVDAEFAMMEEVLMSRRNQAWIPVIEAAAAEGPVFVAFGALHLAGEKGVLNLLAQDGWQVERLPLLP
ncbi:TraB/GumN family protein [Gemmobacter serpentinus]|uniref:TraB/GumN family protein n=1 Tax=Gemmobacter serpentinus TaxID=2652247 RepID=UPI001CF61362|nr:TraB/GumN family protein [Gemmobacter serpentinus]